MCTLFAKRYRPNNAYAEYVKLLQNPKQFKQDMLAYDVETLDMPRASKAAKIVHENDLTIDGMSKVSKAGAR